jgi:hypothetical protein
MTHDERPNVVSLYDTNRRDVSATLRVIADEIDAGKHGEAHQFVLVLDAAGTAIFGGGADDTPKAAIGLLMIGATCLARTIAEANP